MNIGIEQSDPWAARMRIGLAAIAAVTIVGVPFHSSADGRKHHDDDHHHHKQKLLTCDDTLKDDFRTDSLTTVLLVKEFKQGQDLTLTTPGPTTPIAANDVCVVKLLVGPGNPGPAGAPSTSTGRRPPSSPLGSRRRSARTRRRARRPGGCGSGSRPPRSGSAPVPAECRGNGAVRSGRRPA